MINLSGQGKPEETWQKFAAFTWGNSNWGIDMD
jgi:hypothetical protein